MRAISGLVLAGWLASGVVAPCLVRGGCAAPARHECCCGHAGTCGCRLSAAPSPASSPSVATLTASTDPLSFSTSQPPALNAHVLRASAPDDAAATGCGLGKSPPSYLSSHAFRC